MKKHIFELTPLGKADKEIKSYLKEELDEQQLEKYSSSLRHYRNMKVIQVMLRGLFYASVVTSVAATIGFGGRLDFFQNVASYVGTTVIVILYAVTSYITMIRKEAYHVQREILIAKASNPS